jgi:hypothetical protein
MGKLIKRQIFETMENTTKGEVRVEPRAISKIYNWDGHIYIT